MHYLVIVYSDGSFHELAYPNLSAAQAQVESIMNDQESNRRPVFIKVYQGKRFNVKYSTIKLEEGGIEEVPL